MGDALWGSERVLFRDGLRKLSEIAAWRVAREPARWMVLTLGNTTLDESLYPYELSGRGYEFICQVVAADVPAGLLKRLDALSGISDLEAALRNGDDPSEPRRVLSTDVPPLETVNGRVHFAERSSLRLGHGFHQLLGYQHPIQDDVVVQRLIAMRGLEYPIGPETWAELEHEAASEWVTLLQLESSGGPGWDFVTGASCSSSVV
jgi:hypothetical protein